MRVDLRRLSSMLWTSCLALSLAALGSGCVTPDRLPLPPSTQSLPANVELRTLDGGVQELCLRDFPAVAAMKQEGDTACWAACAAMVSTWDHRPMSQSEIAAKIKGRADTDDPSKIEAASKQEVLLALIPEKKEQLDKNWEAWNERLDRALQKANEASAASDAGLADESEADAAAMEALGIFLGGLFAESVDSFSYMEIEHVHADLQSGQPVVIGLNKPLPQDEDAAGSGGHAYVLYGLTCTYAPDSSASRDGGYTYHTAKLIDPWTGESVDVDVNALLERAGFMVSRAQAERVLEAETSLLQ